MAASKSSAEKWVVEKIPGIMLVALALMSCAPPSEKPSSTDVGGTADTAAVRVEIEQWYEKNKAAMLAKDVDAVMALRTEDFHSVTPDSVMHDRAEMEDRTRGLFNGIDRWIAQSFELDSLRVSGDLASAVVHQHIERMALRSDGKVHHLETWVTQRETWRKTPDGWKLYRVDNLRDQRKLVDGQPD